MKKIIGIGLLVMLLGAHKAQAFGLTFAAAGTGTVIISAYKAYRAYNDYMNDEQAGNIRTHKRKLEDKLEQFNELERLKQEGAQYRKAIKISTNISPRSTKQLLAHLGQFLQYKERRINSLEEKTRGYTKEQVMADIQTCESQL